MLDIQVQALSELSGSLPGPTLFQITQGGSNSANEKFFPTTTWVGDSPLSLTQANFPKDVEEKKL